MPLDRAVSTLQSFRKGRIPGQLVVQLTDHCNARCPQCGMRKTEPFRRSRLSTDRVKRIIDAAAEKGFQAISFTGGEPLLWLDDLTDLIRHAGAAGIPFIRTGTNGFIFMGAGKPDFEKRMERIAKTLADTPLRNFWISIDSADPAVHERMRGFPGVIEGIRKALPIFHDRGLFPSANLGINRNIAGDGMESRVVGEGDPERFIETYRSGFRRFYRFVIDLGFTMVNCCYPMSIDDDTGDKARTDGLSPVYAATSPDAVVKFSHREKALLFRTLLTTLPEFRSQVRIFTPRISLYALWRQYALNGNGNGRPAYPCRGGIDFFFIDARDGNAYPCGYRGNDNFGAMEAFDPSAMTPNGGGAGRECRACDWECFRDPSELMGPLLEGLRHPAAVLARMAKAPLYRRLWMEDLRYYRACDFFHGRVPPKPDRLRRF